jgi:hypothetical protein
LQPSAQNTVAGGSSSGGGGAVPSVSVNLSYTLKDEKLVRTGKQVFEMDVRRAMNQTTVCGGFIGIGQYSKDIQEEVVLVVPGDDWEKAYLSLPRIVSDDDMNIEEVTLTAALNDGKKSYDQQVATWTPEAGWTGLGTKGGDEEMRRFAFATMALKAALGDKWKDSYFTLDSAITYKPPLLSRPLKYQGSTRINLFSGNAPVSSPLDMAELWLFDAGYLLFKDDDPDSTLQRVEILVASDGLSGRVSVRIDPTQKDARMLPVLIGRDAKSVRATINFVTTDGKRIQWDNNGKNLKEIPDYQGGMVFLSDWDWME